jgi:hypothetical protein
VLAVSAGATVFSYSVELLLEGFLLLRLVRPRHCCQLMSVQLEQDRAGLEKEMDAKFSVKANRVGKETQFLKGLLKSMMEDRRTKTRCRMTSNTGRVLVAGQHCLCCAGAGSPPKFST